MARKQLLTTDDAKPAKKQHTVPCSDCPWARVSLNGWLGGLTVADWLAEAHGECRIDCHVHEGAQCAGAAIYRANVCKEPLDRTLLQLGTDRVKVFATPMEFQEHHESRPNGKKEKAD